ncbi:Dihydrolipoamide acetyltransferase component of pyruvate dehydrogenase complex [Sarracenia purpurea var. burkii]
MIFMRIWRHQKPWNSARRWWLCSSASHALPPTPLACQQKSPVIGFSSQVNNFRSPALACLAINRADLNIHYDTRRCCLSTQALIDLALGGMVDVPLAQTGEGIAECELLKWFVQEGDEIEEFQPLCEVQSDKATIEITSRYKGKVSQILHAPGNIVKVGETLLKMTVGELPVPTQTADNFENTKSATVEISNSNNQSSVFKKTYIGGVLSTPAVRNLAKQYGINISDVNGTGKDGKVLREDVLKYAADKGIVNEALVSSSGSSGEQLLGGEEECSHVSVAHEWKYGDENVTLR